jgi:Spy/CpxP family protein refolding chaperone
MSAALKWKLALGFVLVFLAGLAAGAFIGTARLNPRHADFVHHRSLADRMRSQMKAHLNLTPAQVEQTTPIFEQTARQLETIRADTGRRVHETLAESDRELAKTLTPEQRTKLEAFAARREASRDNRRGPRPEPADPRPE